MSQALLGDCLLRQPEARGARGASSLGGRLGEGQHGEWGYSRRSLCLLDFSNWDRGELNPSQSIQNSKPSPVHQSPTCVPLSSHHPRLPTITSLPQNDPSVLLLWSCSSPSLAGLLPLSLVHRKERGFWSQESAAHPY